MKQHEIQSVRMNCSENNLSQGTSNNILLVNIFRVNQKHLHEQEILKYYLGKLVWIFFPNLYIGDNKCFEGNNIYFFSSHIGILFSNIFKIIKLAHFSALDSGPIWLFTLKYGDQNDISINILWLVSAFFLHCFCLLVRSFIAIK